MFSRLHRAARRPPTLPKHVFVLQDADTGSVRSVWIHLFPALDAAFWDATLGEHEAGRWSADGRLGGTWGDWSDDSQKARHALEDDVPKSSPIWLDLARGPVLLHVKTGEALYLVVRQGLHGR